MAVSVGRAGEDLVAEVAAQSLFFDFVHQRPYYRRGSQQRELCDLLIAVDQDTLLIEVKTQSTQRANEDEVSWFHKHLGKARRQLSGARTAIDRYPICAQNRVRELVRWAPGDLTVLHTVAVFDVERAYALPFDLGSSGARGLRAQCFTFRDFLNLTRHLGTFPDLVEYLNARATIPTWALPGIGAEQDLYAYYILHDSRFLPTVGVEDIRGQWELLTRRHGRSFAEKLRADEYTDLINKMIREAHELDSSLGRQVMPGHEAPTSIEAQRRTYLKAAALLNRLPNLLRRSLGEEIVRKAQSAADERRPRYFATRHPAAAAALVFHVSALDRAERCRQVQVVLWAAMARFGVSTGLGVAAPDLSVRGHAFDYVWAEGLDLAQDPELIQMSRQVLGDERRVVAWEFPQ